MGRRGREKFNVGSASRRRTVLQIEPVSRRKENEGTVQLSSRKREINPTSISGIGLLGQYAENSDEDEEQQGSSSGEENTKDLDETKPSENVQIDSKLDDFFKEIEAIGTEDSTSTEVSGQTVTRDSTSLEEQADGSAVYQNVKDYVLPEPWQEVCDPTTNYVYYWNTLTNEVSWELPHICGPTEMQISTVENVQQSSLSGNQLVQDNQDEYQSSSSDEENTAEPNDNTMQTADHAEGVHKVAVELEESPILGTAIILPGSTSGLAKREIASSSPDNLIAERLDQNLNNTSLKSNEQCEGLKPESLSISRKRERSEEVDIFEAIADEGDDNSKKEQSSEYWDEEKRKNAVGEEMPEYNPMPDNISPRNSTDEQDDDKSVDVESDGEERKKCDKSKRPMLDDINNDDTDPIVPAKKVKVNEENDEDESEEDFAEKLLEEFFEGKAGDNVTSGDDMDVESDEQQDLHGPKSLLPPEAFLPNQADRLVEEGSASPADVSRSRVNVDKIAEEENQKLTTEIHDLCQLLSNKLEFLNINKDGVNKLLIVLIQMETRIKDWREGNLSSAYMVKKLRDAAEELKSYEQSAIPQGWSCNWDSTYKRYFYTNDKTGESQWDYPQTPSETFPIEKQKVVSETNIKESSSSYSVSKSSIESHIYHPNILQNATYPVVTVSPSTSVSTHIGPGISSFGLSMNETNCNMFSSTVNPDPNNANVYPAFQPTQNPIPTDVTKDPYRLDDDSPPAPGSTTEHEVTPTPPGSSSPPPLPNDLETIAPPPPPQEPPPVSEDCKQSIQTEHVDKGGKIKASPPHLTNVNSQGSRSSGSSPVPVQPITKQKKKKSKSSGAIRTSKVKQMSSLVQKWQAIKRQEEVLSEDESDEEHSAAKNEAQIEQWRQEQIKSGMAVDNPNFEKITGDWRERVRKAKLRALTDTK
ncbi:formin-binding protein 4-like [Dendronephthya gigantea]|uniref:formin-binding protein 4-like n=1 Tax=Dendronephthya gigantea TaxID=151771 RepID=UPI00106B43C5|nr:formin-binding protein 4-like [Dendronephthya gigantea]